MKQEIYRSETLGDIPLSFTGRHLLQNLREAINEYTKLTLRRNGGIPFSQVVYSAEDWKPVSVARGKLAEYMSKLERRSERPRAYESRNDDACGSFKQTQNYGGWPFGVPKQNPFEVAGSVLATVEATEKAKDGGYHMHLPPIPPGYVLRIVGNLAAIEPEEMKPHEADNGENKMIAEQRKMQRNEKFRSLLNKYSVAITRPFNGERSQTQVDDARHALYDFIERMP